MIIDFWRMDLSYLNFEQLNKCHTPTSLPCANCRGSMESTVNPSPSEVSCQPKRPVTLD